MLQLREKDLKNIIVIGDRILIRPSKPKTKTDAGLYLPQGIHKKEELYTGYVIKVGPGYPIPAITDVDEPWKDKADEVKYVPLQPKPGDLAVYMQKNSWEIEFNGQSLVIVPHSALLMLIREDD
jgi:co-chaperonin GroES (HSP10)